MIWTNAEKVCTIEKSSDFSVDVITACCAGFYRCNTDKVMCSIGVEQQRIQWIWRHETKSLEVVPTTLQNNTWVSVHPKNVKVQSPCAGDLESSESFKSYMIKQMLLQFRTSVESYYGTFPSHEEVLSIVARCSTKEDLQAKKLTVYEAAIQRDDEWAGGYKILCSDGVVVVPYSKGLPYLLVEYATYFPDRKIGHVARVLVRKSQSASEKIGLLSWSSFRRKVERVWQ